MWGSEGTSSPRKNLDAMTDRHTHELVCSLIKQCLHSVNKSQDYAEGAFQTLRVYYCHKKGPSFEG